MHGKLRFFIYHLCNMSWFRTKENFFSSYVRYVAFHLYSIFVWCWAVDYSTSISDAWCLCPLWIVKPLLHLQCTVFYVISHIEYLLFLLELFKCPKITFIVGKSIFWGHFIFFNFKSFRKCSVLKISKFCL